MAAAGQPGAQDGLLAFVEALPNHPRRFEALVALAELSLNEVPVKPDEVNRRIADATATAKIPAALETAAWLKVLAAEKTAAPDDYAREATAFLTAWPQTARRAPLRMRLGEMYFRRQLFPNARQQFEQLEKDDPLHPLAEAALYWAGKSAQLTLQGKASDDDAIQLWERVYNSKRGSALKLEARLQVARLKQRRNAHDGALEILNSIMNEKPAPDANTRRQVLCARGEILVAQNASPESVAQGLASFDQLVNDTKMPLAWRQEAMVLKGTCLEQLKRNDEALEVWYSVLNEPPAAEGEDDYWFHRAGEKALRMLDSRQKYEQAVGIAGKMAKAPGARGKAAAELVNQLALKYGIWLDMKK
jgi:TolA-binding protein